MIEVDFNSDMGEGVGAWTLGDGVDDQLLDLVSSANIATGFHAGDPGLMQRTVQQAKARNVAIGAHPGYRDLVGFGLAGTGRADPTSLFAAIETCARLARREAG